MKRSCLTLVALLLTALCGLAAPVTAQAPPINSYSAVQIGGEDVAAYGLNDAGQVVGQSGSHAYVWQNGVMTDLGTPGGAWSTASGINNSGQVVGTANTAAGAVHAFLWSAGAGMSDLGTLGGAASAAPYTLQVTLPTATSYADGTVTAGTTYFYVVKAQKGTQESAYSNQASAMPR